MVLEAWVLLMEEEGEEEREEAGGLEDDTSWAARVPCLRCVEGGRRRLELV